MKNHRCNCDTGDSGGGVGAGARPSTSRCDTELMDSGSRQSRREMFETSKTAEVTKSKSMSLKSQLKSPFKFLGKTYCGGCKVQITSAFIVWNDSYGQ